MSISRSMREAWLEMGNAKYTTYGSGDRFVTEAIRWLTIVAPIEITRINDGEDGESWVVKSDKYSSPDSTLIGALCGAVFCVKAIETESSVRRMSEALSEPAVVRYEEFRRDELGLE